MQEVIKMKGIFDLTNRIVKVLLSKPLVRRNFSTVLYHIDPENAPDLVHTLLWDDLGMGLMLMDAVPKLANAAILALDELLKQVDDHFNPAFLQQVVKLMLEDVDLATWQDATVRLTNLMRMLQPVFAEAAAAADNQPTSTQGGAA